MKNLEQVRAAAALETARHLDKKAVNKLPALILNNGLLATIAFVNSDSSGANRKDMLDAMLATGKHLHHRNLVSGVFESLDQLASDLASKSSIHLQRATTEALAYIGYLRRFATKGNDSNED